MNRAVLIATLCAGAATTGCATQVMSSSPEASVAPALSVERFLQAANAQRLDEMSRLFGTADGPIGDTGSALGCGFKKLGSWFGMGDRCATRAEVEVRMNTIAILLRHQDYRVVDDQPVPGRAHQTLRVSVNLTQTGRTVQDVPFTVVRSGEGRWLIEQIGLERVTSRR